MDTSKKNTELRCADYFSSQYGLISRPQTLAIGLTPRAIEVRHSSGR
jgi:hypothetical protein